MEPTRAASKPYIKKAKKYNKGNLLFGWLALVIVAMGQNVKPVKIYCVW